MPDDKKADAQPAAQAPQPVFLVAEPVTPPPAPTERLDETVPGGRYIVNGQEVNAGGEPYQKDHDKNLKSAMDASRV